MKIKTVTKTTNSEKETIAFGKQLGKKLKKGDVVALFGNLGTGKTHLIKGIGKSLNVTSLINSPTFSLINEYKGSIDLYHFDVYRLNDIYAAYNIGVDEYFDSNGITVVEWAERIEEILPKRTIRIRLDFISQNKRKITVDGLN